jgi:disulfide bond formation protein DsbB
MFVNLIFAIGTFVLQIFVVVLLINLFFKNEKLTGFISSNFSKLGFGISAIAVSVSLTYSIVLGYAPCLLCWWARIFFFPQLIIFSVAWLKQKNVGLEVLILSVFGIAVTAYHTYIDFGGGALVSCETGGVSCLKRYVFEFGYITIPVMALTGFVLLALLAIYKLKKIKK